MASRQQDHSNAQLGNESTDRESSSGSDELQQAVMADVFFAGRQNTCPCSDEANRASISTEHFGSGNVPEKLRNINIRRYLMHLSILTFRVVVTCTSSATPNHRGGMAGNGETRVGTGSMIVDPLDEGHGHGANSPSGEDTIHVRTHDTLVCNNEEAESATVEWLYFHEDRRNVKVFHGTHVLGPSINGVVVLVCRVDAGIKNELLKKLEECRKMLKTIPDSVKQDFENEVIVIHYPHGGAQYISIGKYQLHNYTTVIGERGERLQMLCKHTATTCAGSVGAAIIRFRYETRCYILEVCMHKGAQRRGKQSFGISVLKDFAVSCEEIGVPDPQLLPMPPASRHQSSTFRSVVTLPFCAQLGNEHMRASSFPNDIPRDIKLKLASLGFYYIDPSCIRCYYCGLIMKKWRDVCVDQRHVQYVADVHGYSQAQFIHPTDCKNESNIDEQESTLNEHEVVTSLQGSQGDVHHFISLEKGDRLVVGLPFRQNNNA